MQNPYYSNSSFHGTPVQYNQPAMSPSYSMNNMQPVQSPSVPPQAPVQNQNVVVSLQAPQIAPQSVPQSTSLDPMRWVRRESQCPCGCQVPFLSALLSFFFPGFGVLFNGQIFKGLFIYITFVLVMLLIALLFVIPVVGWTVGTFFEIFWNIMVRICAAQDAYMITSRLWYGYPVMYEECGNQYIATMLSWSGTPGFVSGSPYSPQEWKDMMSKHQRY